MMFVFGPVSSRRFGISMGVDLSPDKKRCNFDCLYCELKAAKPVNTFDDPADPKLIVSEVAEKLKSRDPDVITITANGEPTIYPFLNELIDMLLPIKKSAKIMILSNSSTIADENTRKALMKLDIVKLSLDSALQKSFKRIDRALKDVKIEDIIKAIAEFKKNYNGFLAIEVLLAQNINDSEDDFEALKAALNRIMPDRVDIGTIDRPPAYKINAVANETMQNLLDRLEGLNAQIIPNKRAARKNDYDRGELISLLKRRAISDLEAAAILSDRSLRLLKNLLANDEIATKSINNRVFYTFD
jgi:wyosine [tRNA(Phe)-imidazoG37] synthetase (radical SAM superfamily)